MQPREISSLQTSYLIVYGTFLICSVSNFGCSGEVSEWPKEHAWKACVRQRTEGSNPSLSASFLYKMYIRSLLYHLPLLKVDRNL